MKLLKILKITFLANTIVRQHSYITKATFFFTQILFCFKAGLINHVQDAEQFGLPLPG